MAILDYFIFDETLNQIFLMVSTIISLFFFLNGADFFVKLNINNPRLAVIRENTLFHMIPAFILLVIPWIGSISDDRSRNALYNVAVILFLLAIWWRYFGFTGIFLPVNNPFFISAEEAEKQIPDYLRDDLILGLEMEGEKRVYPIKPLQITHVVNDTFQGKDIAVTFCGLCNLGIVFDRNIEGEARNLRAVYAGKSNLVVTDDKGNYWQQLTGKGLLGKYAKTHPLKMYDAMVTTWESWKNKNPDTMVLGNTLEGRTKFGFKWFKKLLHLVRKTDFILFPAGEMNNQFGPKDQLLGVVHKKVSLAIPVEQYDGIIEFNRKLDDTSVYIFFDTETKIYGAFEKATENEFQIIELDNQIRIKEIGGSNEWDLYGNKISAKDDLVPVKKMYPAFWFAWIGHYPETEVLLNDNQ